MRIEGELRRGFYENNWHLRRRSWPKGDYICVDGADEVIWYYRDADDELFHYRLGFHDLGSDDWEIEL